MDIKNSITGKNISSTKVSKLIKRFCSYVAIDSESGFEKTMCDTVFNDLSIMGYSPEKLKLENNFTTTGYNIHLFVNGDLPGPSLLLNAHLDTVSPGRNVKPIINNDVIKSGGKTILGADDKSGVAAIVTLLETLKNNKIKHRDIEIIFTVGEESGLYGSLGLNIKKIKSTFGYVFDSSNPVGGMIVAAPSSCLVDIEVYGKSAHAGRSPEKGISAIQVASKALSNIPLLRIDEDTTCNVASFVSDYALNVVPDKAILKFNVRSLVEDKMNHQVDIINKKFDDACKDYGADFNINVENRYKSYKKNDSDHSIKFIKKSMNKLNINPYYIKACGGSDAHIYNAQGIDVVNLGVGNENVHSLDEQIKVSELILLYKLILQIISSTD